MDDGLYGFAAEHGFLAPAPAFSQRKSLKGSLCLLHVFYKMTRNGLMIVLFYFGFCICMMKETAPGGGRYSRPLYGEFISERRQAASTRMGW